ncbi:hypothetical protein T01_254 [Trichinella spiralis]|uniref:Uncharacterized protein n=1 Tax=Trichinella spiralis TaxID=6334 RepID=A0A0V1B915_TRISP|nr:hypothetical protein T01_254 [Trichinella spiralis]
MIVANIGGSYSKNQQKLIKQKSSCARHGQLKAAGRSIFHHICLPLLQLRAQLAQ